MNTNRHRHFQNGRRNTKTGAVVVGLLIALAAPAARASDYTASVLYPLLLPDGSSSGSIIFNSAVAGMATGEDVDTGNALVWTSSIGTTLNAAGYYSTTSTAFSGNRVVGSGNLGPHGPAAALMWNSPASTPLNLSPSGMTSSEIEGADSTQEVGDGEYDDGTNPVDIGLLWTGASPNAVVLAPPAGFDGSTAYGVDGHEQVGGGETTAGPSPGEHALLWYGSTASVVDLHPAGFAESVAFATDGTQQVGWGSILYSGGDNALLWYGTAASVVNLNAPGYSSTRALATNGSRQAGDGESIADGGSSHALLWSGSADSFVDLNDLLPSTGIWFGGSGAVSIDPAGNVFGWAFGTYDGYTDTFLVEWSPVPEPGVLGLMAGGWMFLRRTRRTSAAAKRCRHASAAPAADAE